jgi:hypothetical protein
MSRLNQKSRMWTTNYIYHQLYRGDRFYWWRKPKYPEKTTDLSQVADKLLSHNVVLSTPRLIQIRTHNFISFPGLDCSSVVCRQVCLYFNIPTSFVPRIANSSDVKTISQGTMQRLDGKKYQK